MGSWLGHLALGTVGGRVFQRLRLSVSVWTASFGFSCFLRELDLMAGPWTWDVFMVLVLLDAVFLMDFFDADRVAARDLPAWCS
jgi:hypothetical protein